MSCAEFVTRRKMLKTFFPDQSTLVQFSFIKFALLANEASMVFLLVKLETIHIHIHINL